MRHLLRGPVQPSTLAPSGTEACRLTNGYRRVPLHVRNKGQQALPGMSTVCSFRETSQSPLVVSPTIRVYSASLL